MKYYAIIVAGGSGSRMNSDVPKQFLLLNSKPVLMHTIEAFNRSVLSPEIVLTLNPQYFSFWQDLCKQHNFTIPHKIVSSGEHRFHSVKNGLDLVENGSITAIHDGVRPIVSADLITRTFHLAEQKKAVIPVIMSKDSVRMKTGEKSVVLKREDILLVQTPQTFQSTLLKSAYLQQ
ncbi:MAG: 2-C-methyl-D-erythritol 4-phosphate cytidylyltransferase, partial [Pyrinomonadaceae bacterium]|nr:2-C-methyl-D-erythritol 4-phosphate cytidylyltransferase [Sphingobacteriaceae bacterium]